MERQLGFDLFLYLLNFNRDTIAAGPGNAGLAAIVCGSWIQALAVTLLFFMKRRERAAAMDQPTGHANQMPVAEPVRSEKAKARTTRRIRSVKVAIIKRVMALVPRRTPSATSLAEMTK